MGHKTEVQPGLYLLAPKPGWPLTGRIKYSEDKISDVNMLLLVH